MGRHHNITQDATAELIAGYYLHFYGENAFTQWMKNICDTNTNQRKISTSFHEQDEQVTNILSTLTNQLWIEDIDWFLSDDDFGQKLPAEAVVAKPDDSLLEYKYKRQYEEKIVGSLIEIYDLVPKSFRYNHPSLGTIEYRNLNFDAENSEKENMRVAEDVKDYILGKNHQNSKTGQVVKVLMPSTGTSLFNLNNPHQYFDVQILTDITTQIVKYRDKIGAKKIELVSLEDNTWEDAINQRYDLWIRIYDGEGGVYNQKCLFLKNELIMPDEFHRRHDEYYPDRTGPTRAKWAH